MTIAARGRVKRKIIEEGWSRGITPEWVELTSSLKKKWCNGVAKYTILRWAVNQDDDIWLTKRGTRHGQRCSQCSPKGDSFPAGHTGLPLCERCIQAHQITPAKYCPFGEDLLQACHTHFHTSQVSDGPQATENQESNAMSQFQQVQSRPAGSCVACGCGDNTIGHWTRWCIIPFAVVWIILQPSSLVQCLSDLAVISPVHNAICTLTLAAFRRLLRQEGAFYHQTPNEPKSICWWIDMLLSAVSQDAPQELEMPFFRTTRCTPRCKVDSNAIALSRVLPVDIDTLHLPPVVCSLQKDGSPGDVVAILPVESLHCAALRELQRHVPEMEQNVTLQILHCPCGEYHVQSCPSQTRGCGRYTCPRQFWRSKDFCAI